MSLNENPRRKSALSNPNEGGQFSSASRSSAVKFGVDSAFSGGDDFSTKENQDFQERFLNFLKMQDLETESAYANEEETEEESSNEEDETIFEIYITRPIRKLDKEEDQNKSGAKVTRIVSDSFQQPAKSPNYMKTIDREDGVFRGKNFPVKKRNYAHLYDRLRIEDANEQFYFNEEGEIRSDTPMVRRTVAIDDINKENEVIDRHMIYCFAPARIVDLSAVILTRTIRIEVSKIDFRVHYLSSKANILIKTILDLYKSISQETELSRVQYYNTKIKLLRELLNSGDHKEDRLQLLEEVVALQDLKDVEECKVRELRDILLDTWHMLKDLQEETFISAPFVLKWLAQKRNESETQFEEAIFEREYKQRAKEIAELEKLKNNNEIDVGETVESLRAERNKMGLRLPGETTWEPVLKPIEIHEAQEITDEEKERRQLVSKTKVFAVIRVSKNPIRSPPTPLSIDMTADLNIGVRITCMHAPQSIPVEIWESGQEGKRKIGMIRVPVVNGVPSLSSSASQPIQFTSDEAIGGSLIQGTLKAVAYIEPDKLSSETVLHDRSHQGYIMKSLKSNPSSFLSVPKYVEETAQHDPNDPYYQEKLDAAHVTHDPQMTKNTFKLDQNEYSTKFSSMAPLMVHKELPIRAFRKDNQVQPKKKEKKPPILNDDIVEEKPLTLSRCFSSIKRLFARRRPLFPSYIEEEKAPTSEESDDSTKLVSIH